MHEKFIAWFYSLESVWDAISYNISPYICFGFLLIAFLIIAFWCALFVLGFLQVGFSRLWDCFKPAVDRVKKKGRVKNG